jgi:hypothetical protein
MKARKLLSDKRVFPDGAIVEMKVWLVPPSPRTPEGFKYSLAYIDAHGRRILGFDNAEGKGHHRHDRDRETPFSFTSIGDIRRQFEEEVARIRRDLL